MISTCSICSDDSGFYFCRLCCSHYCAEHLCLHLNTAWEDSTWSSREQESGELRYGLNTGLEETIRGNDILDKYQEEASSKAKTSSIPSPLNPRTLPSISEKQLQNMLDFYATQARRIRAELERRSISISGLDSEYERIRQGFSYTTKRSSVRNQNARNRNISKIVELFSRNVREGKMSIEQIEILLRSKL